MKNRIVSIILLISFGIPSFFGLGLHLFLPSSNNDFICSSCCDLHGGLLHVHNDSHSIANEHTSVGHLDIELNSANAPFEIHAAELCILCLYFAQSKSSVLAIADDSGYTPVCNLDTTNESTLFSLSPSIKRVRGPPLLFTAC